MGVGIGGGFSLCVLTCEASADYIGVAGGVVVGDEGLQRYLVRPVLVQALESQVRHLVAALYIIWYMLLD